MVSDDEVARTAKERAAIKKLEALGAVWPKSLVLFSWAGSLTVIRAEDYEAGPDEQREAMMAGRIVYIEGIYNDGGDP